MKRVVDVMVVIIILLLAFIFLDFSLNKGEIITGLIGYAGNANGNLTIWDDTDNGTFYTNQEIVFYANFTNSTGQPISDSEGNVTINLKGSLYSMDFNSTSGLWHYSTSFTNAGTFEYNVTANSSVYALDLMAIDNCTIASIVHFVPGDYLTLEDCFDAINNTHHICKINVSNYYEKFSVPNKKYNFSSLGYGTYTLFIEDLDNVTIDFNNASVNKNDDVFIRAKGPAIVPAVNYTFRNFNYESLGDSSFGMTTEGIIGSQNIMLENVSIISKNSIASHGPVLIMKNVLFNAVPSIEGNHELFSGNIYIYNSTLTGGVISLEAGTLNLVVRNSFFNDTFLNNDVTNLNTDIRNSMFNFSTIKMEGVLGTTIVLVNNSFSHGIEGKNCIDVLSVVATGSNLIEGNTFENCGLVEYNETYIISDSMYSYGGNNFNESTPALANTDLSQIISISHNGTDVSGIATGLNNFSLWLMDLTSIGFPWVVVYVEQPNAISCNDFATAYGGTCYLDEQDYLQANGQYQNYTVKNVSGLSIIQGNDKMFMNYLNTTFFYANSSIFIDGPVPTNISRNIFKNSTSITMKSGTANIWLNVFINYPPIVESAANASLCVNGSGNFYGESADVPSGDCGQVNLTSSSFTGSIQFKRQSSPILPVHYDIFRLAGTNWSFVGSVSSSSTGNISYSWPFSSGAYTIKIVPWINGSRINGTNFNGSFNFTAELAEAPKAKKGGGGTSVNVPPYIAKNVTKEEAVPAAKEVVNITPKPPAVEKPAPAPQLPAPSAAPAPALPEKKPVAWTTPLIVAIFIVAIIVILAVLKHIKKKKPVTEG